MFIPSRRLRAGVPVFVFFAASVTAVFALTPQAAFPGPPPTPTANTTATAIQGLRPALAQVGSAVADLRVSRWKGSADLRGSTQDDVASIQRDLTNALPPLIDQAQASGQPSGPLTPAFALFRNIDALYDVLLRVTETSNMVAPSSEANELESARAALESARGQLGNALIASATAQDTQLAHFRAEATTAPPKPEAEPSKIVVDDGPTPAATAKRKKKKPTTTTTTPQQ